jgi:thiol-disulfide isomerase/thioredoxin
MKKVFLLSIFLLTILFSDAPKTNAVTFDEAMSQSKPIALFLYADWADNAQSMLGVFNQMEQQYGNSYNFVKINIGNKDAWYGFNSAYNRYSTLFSSKSRIQYIY